MKEVIFLGFIYWLSLSPLAYLAKIHLHFKEINARSIHHIHNFHQK